MSLKVALPELVPTPFSKKQPPPNERPTRSGAAAAASNAAAVSASTIPDWPFQSDHMAGFTFAVTTAVPGAVNSALEGFDHQKFVYANGPFAYTNFWWSNPSSAVLTAPGTAVVTANVNPAMWSDWNGQSGIVDAETAAAFEAAAAAPDLVGLSFGGGCFFENGVGTSSGSATFRLISYTIE